MKFSVKKFLRIAIAASLISASAGTAEAAVIHGSRGSPVHGWQTLKIGAGGYVRLVDWANASAPFLNCTDVGGCYEFSGGKWVQLITTNSMPSSLLGRESWLNGGYEIASAPSDPTRCYLGYSINNGGFNTSHILKSDNCNSPASITWTDLTSFQTACSTGCVWSPNTQGGPTTNYALSGRKLAVDPKNKNVFYLTTPSNGQFVSVDAGASFCAVNSVTASAGSMPALVAIDPTSTTVSTSLCGSSVSRSSTVWICPQGAGCWKSTDGSVTSTQQTSGTGPTTTGHMKIGIDGTVYVTSQDRTQVWRFTTTWTDITPPSVGATNYTITTYTTDATKLIVTSPAGDGSFLTSANSGTPSYSGTQTGFPTRSTSDIPWFLATPANSLDVGETVMDQNTDGKVWASAGIGMWYSTSTTGIPAWNGISNGIEELVSNRIVSPSGCGPVGGFWDRAVFYLPPLNSYKTGYGPNYGSPGDINMGWGVDYASSDANYIALLSNFSDTDSSYSLDCGQTWTTYPNFPNLVGGFIGGGIAASTHDNVMFAAANGGDIYYSKNATSGSAVWTKILAATFGHGMQQGNGSVQPGWGITYTVPHQAVCADRVTTGTFYAYNSQTNALGGGFYRSTDQGDTFAQMAGQFASGNDSGGFDNRIYCVPGHGGHLFYTGGQNLSALYHSEDGGTTQLPISGIGCTPSSVYDVTTGAVKPGNNYPSVFFVGVCGTTFGVWRSDNTASDWSVGTNISWTGLALPNGYGDQPTTLAGDNNVWGQVFMGSKGTGAVYYAP